MDALLNSVINVLREVWVLVTVVGQLVLPWTPLIAWVVYWLFAPNWVKLRQVLIHGGWVGLVLIGLVMVLVWGVVSPPPGGTVDMFGLKVSNFVEKAVYVSGLMCMMLLAGSLQLSGFGANCCHFADPLERIALADSHGDHGHGGHDHDSHDHDAHSHDHDASHSHDHDGHSHDHAH